tara:strand:+ start:1 stop:1014 length:1014 start_codon:yes stop_codon:yes gene_type:complete
MDYDSGMIIASKNPDLMLPPASITKIMTSYLAFTELKDKAISMDDEVVISKKAWKMGGSKMFIEVGKKVKVSDLLKGVIVSSGNDASVALAEYISGDEETFVNYMNQTAQSMNLNNTNYANSTGLPDKQLYTTSRDIAILSRALIKDFPRYYKMYRQKEYIFNEIKQYSRNKLMHMDDSVDGIKTGFTKKAGYCLASSSKRGGRRLISVVLGAKNPGQRIQVSKSLLEYGFRFFETHKVFKKDVEVHKARVYAGDETMLPVGFTEDYFISIPRRQYKNITKEFIIDKNLTAPVAKNDVVGFIAIKLKNKTLSTAKLVALQDIKTGNMLRRTIDSFIK